MAVKYDYCEACGSDKVTNKQNASGTWISTCAACNKVVVVAEKISNPG